MNRPSTSDYRAAPLLRQWLRFTLFLAPAGLPDDRLGTEAHSMSQDWIKMRTDLYRDPKTIVIAEILMGYDGKLARHVSQNMQCDMAVTDNIMRNATVGALLSVWGVARHRGHRDGDDLTIAGVTRYVVDSIADLPGFGDAMIESGWLVEEENSLRFPRFFADNNVDPNQISQAKNRERQQRYRDRQRNVTDNAVTHREEKRREEKSSSEPAAQSPKPAKKPPKLPKKKRQPDPVWDTVVALWFPSGATGREKRIGKLVRQFKGVGATEASLRSRHAMYLKHWPGIDCTPDALFKHWDQIKDESHVGETDRGGRIPAQPGQYDHLD